MRTKLDEITNVNICAVSFCESPDLLSQWRGYSGTRGGVSIGFCSDKIVELAKREHGRLAPCIYDHNVQAELIDELIDAVLNTQNEQEENVPIEPLRLSENFNRQLISIGAFFKHEGFHEELEWRLVTGIKLYRERRFKFRTGNSMVIPYYEALLAPEGWTDEIASVTVGPCPYPEVSRQAVIGLLLQNDIYADPRFGERQMEIKSSRIPYRSW